MEPRMRVYYATNCAQSGINSCLRGFGHRQQTGNIGILTASAMRAAPRHFRMETAFSR